MIDRASFNRYIGDAFSHLDDRPYLIAHPLGSIIAGVGQGNTPEEIRRALLDAVGVLRPLVGTPANSPRWRRWTCLALRHVDGLSTKEIARKLEVSDRQARRDHEAGVRAASAVLWAKYAARVRATKPTVPSYAPTVESEQASENGGAAQVEMDAELALLSATSPVDVANLAEVIGSAIATIRNLAEIHHLKVEWSVPDGLGPVAINPSVLRQVLLCLLSAVLQEPCEDDATQLMEIAVARAGTMVELSLLAHRNCRQREPAGDRTNRDVEALIAAARRLIEQAAGSLDMGDTNDDARVIRLQLSAAPAIRVLVVDDNPDVVQLFRRFLAGENYNLVQARTPPAALELARETHPDVITLDVMMPSQDGWQLLQLFRSDPDIQDIPVIVCSILPERPLAVSLGATDFLPKPVTRQSLLSALERSRDLGPKAHPGYRADTSSVRPQSVHHLG